MLHCSPASAMNLPDPLCFSTNSIKENHSYEIPEIIATEIKDGSSDYLDWINNETK